MKVRRFTPSTTAALIAVLLVLLSVGGYFVLQHSVDQQESDLLRSNTVDAGATASSTFSDVTSSLQSDAELVRVTNASPGEFDTFAKQNELSVNLVQKTAAGDYTVLAAAGTGFSPGEILGGPALATVQSTRKNKVTTGPVTSNGKTSQGRFAIGVDDGLFIYEQFSIPTHFSEAQIAVLVGSAFSQLNVALYGPGSTLPGNLLFTKTSAFPLSGPTARTVVGIGGANWTLVAAAQRPFVSGLASSGPVIWLVLGLSMAVVVALTIETVQRRRHYAQAVVEERTADLNASLQELKDTQDALVRSERLSAVGEMASVIGHELRNPLAAVTNSLYIVRHDLGDDASSTTEKYLTLAERETSKAAALADDLTAFVRPRELKKTEMRLRDLVHEVMGATPHPDNVDVVLNVEAVDLVADRGQLAEVLTNLVTNAFQAMPDGGTMRLTGSSDDGDVTIVVEDTGGGLNQDVMDHVFEPFFTTRSSGTGLGLAIVQRLVQAHLGEITLENVATGGVRATVVLPEVVQGVPA
jgi:signal transduction histidine kinase